MKYSTACFSALFLVFAVAGQANPALGTYILSDVIDVRASAIVLSENTHGAEGWAPIDNTFSGRVIISYTMTPKLLGPEADYSNFSQYYSFMLLRKGEPGGANQGDFRLGTGHAQPPALDYFVATLMGSPTQLLVDGNHIHYEEKPFNIKIDITYLAGGNDSAVLTIDEATFNLPDGNYGFQFIDVMAVHDHPGPGADFTNMSVVVIPEPSMAALFLGTIGLGLVLIVRRVRKAG